jgi:hypothetical protein
MGGKLFVAECACGYKSRWMNQGNTPSSTPPITDVPILCLACGAVFLEDPETPEGQSCAECKSNDLQPMGRIENTQFGWDTHLIPGPFPCPRCHRWAMTVGAGQWD